MKFGQLIECNMRNIFLKNHAQYVVENLVPDPSLKMQQISGSTVRIYLQFVFIVFPR